MTTKTVSKRERSTARLRSKRVPSPIERKRLSSPILRLFPPARSTPVTSEIMGPQFLRRSSLKKRGGGFPHPLHSLSHILPYAKLIGSSPSSCSRDGSGPILPAAPLRRR